MMLRVESLAYLLLYNPNYAHRARGLLSLLHRTNLGITFSFSLHTCTFLSKFIDFNQTAWTRLTLNKAGGGVREISPCASKATNEPNHAIHVVVCLKFIYVICGCNKKQPKTITSSLLIKKKTSLHNVVTYDRYVACLVTQSNIFVCTSRFREYKWLFHFINAACDGAQTDLLWLLNKFILIAD